MKQLSVATFLVLMPMLAYAIGGIADVPDRPLVIEADHADYDGEQLALEGMVTLEHKLGTVEARQAHLLHRADPKTLNFSFLRLENDVTVTLWDGGIFHCARADLDYQTMTGCFFGGPSQEYVTYTGNLDKGEGTTAPLVFKSRYMTVNVGQTAADSDRSITQKVKQIIAEKNVTVDYDREFMAAADHMLYERDLEAFGDDPDVPLPGKAYLRPNAAYGICQVGSRQGDLVRASQITIDILNEKLIFDKPTGAISLARDDGNSRRIDFSADLLTWEKPRNLLTLQDNVVLYQHGFGKLTSTDKVQVCQEVIAGQREIKWISSTGETKLVYIDQEEGSPHTLFCYGKLFIDPLQNVATLDSPQVHDVIAEEQQVHFFDDKGEIFADNVVLDYREVEGGIAPTKLTIKGNVKLVNRSSGTAYVRGAPLQYALADVVEYIPATQQMCLYADQGGRVLFYDRVNSVQVSAPAVNVRRDAATGKESVQGLGDVRFTFADSEMDAIKESFEWFNNNEFIR